MTAIVLLGPPGAGKGTVAKVLVERGFTHVSTGRLLREQIRLKTPIGIEAKERLDQGRFASDEIVVEMIRRLLEDADVEQKFLFDGFPRTLAQAERLDELSQTMGLKLAEVILLECPDEQLIERLSGRRTCPQCGTIYHLSYNPSDVDGICNRDGCELKTRPDDAEETVRKRLEIYAERTVPLIDYYRKKNLIQTVDASLSIGQVRNAVAENLDNLCHD